MNGLLEPPEGVIVAWFDSLGDLYAVFHRTDQHAEYEGDPDRWFNADQFDTHDDGPLTWDELLEEMEGNRGPVELVSNGRIEPGHRFAGEDGEPQ